MRKQFVMPFLAGLAGAAMLAAPAMAQEQIAARRAVVDELRAQDCMLAVADAQVLQAARPDAVDSLLGDGLVEVSGTGALTLSADICGLDTAASPESAMVAALRLNGCQMREDAAPTLLGSMGFDRDTSSDAVDVLESRGGASFDNDSGILSLSDALCAGSTAVLDGPATGESPRDALLRLFADNGCAMTQDEAEPLAPAYGLTMDLAGNLADNLMSEGIARVEAGRLIIAAPACIASAAAPPVGESPRQAALRLFADHGCAMTQDEAGPLLPGYGLTMRQVDQLADDFMDEGIAHVEGETLVITAPACQSDQAAPAGTVRARLLEEFQHRPDCAIGFDEMQTLGGMMVPGVMDGALLALLNEGALEPQDQGLQIPAAACAAANSAAPTPTAAEIEAAAQVIAAMPALVTAAHLNAYFAARNCVLDTSDDEALVADAATFLAPRLGHSAAAMMALGDDLGETLEDGIRLMEDRLVEDSESHSLRLVGCVPEAD